MMTDNQLSFPGKVAAGLLAGGCSAIIGNPFDMAMVRMQADGRVPPEHRRNYKNGVDAIYRVIKEEGVATLWRGCIPTISRGMVITASQLAVYDDVKTNLIKHANMTDTPETHVASSLVCSVVAAFTSNPFDVTKSRLQQMKVRKKDGKYPYKNMIDCFMKTVRGEGVAALYKGIGPTIARQIPLNITRFVVTEQLIKLLERDATAADL
jgi:solute carrier family 25 (mitochondrial oxoglutarate transporter), member 11